MQLLTGNEYTLTGVHACPDGNIDYAITLHFDTGDVEQVIHMGTFLNDEGQFDKAALDTAVLAYGNAYAQGKQQESTQTQPQQTALDALQALIGR